MMNESPKSSKEVQTIMRESMEKTERLKLSIHASHELENDPKHMLFRLSRYKFVAKMLRGRGRVLEIGCGDGMGAALVAAEGNEILGVDIEPLAFENAIKTRWTRESMTFLEHDFVSGPITGHSKLDAAYSLDVIEHLDPKNECVFVENICSSLRETAPLIIGTPNKDAAAYQSPQSALQHINLHDQASLQRLLERYFENVFMFGMNDEVLHTGYSAMCHYIFGLAVQRRI